MASERPDARKAARLRVLQQVLLEQSALLAPGAQQLRAAQGLREAQAASLAANGVVPALGGGCLLRLHTDPMLSGCLVGDA